MERTVKLLIDIPIDYYNNCMNDNSDYNIHQWIREGTLISENTTNGNIIKNTISRQEVNTLIDELARAISDERCCISRGRSTATIMQDILHLPPVTPTCEERGKGECPYYAG